MPDRVLLLTTELRMGGAERVVCDLARRLDKARFDPAVAALDGRGPLADRLRAAGVPVYGLGAHRPVQVFGAIQRLTGLLRTERPALVHTHLIHATVVGRLAAARLGLPTVATVHIAERRRRPWHFRLDRWTGRWCAAWTAVSAAVADFHARRTGIARGRFEVIHNGIDLDRMTPSADRGAARAALGLDREALTVGAFGRLDPQKGLDIYLEAVARLAPRHPGVQFVLAGYGPEEARLRERMARPDLAGRVRFLGRVDNPAELYHALDVLAFPSRYEGFGLVLVEAMACGVPTVAAGVDSVPELAGADRAALLVRPENPEALAEAISRLLDAPERRARMAAAARERAQAFDVRAMVTRYQDLYARVLEQERGTESDRPMIRG